MAKPMSNREMELFNIALNYAVLLDRCNPEVGMGPSRFMLAKQIAERLSFPVSEDDLHELCEEVSGS
jgi:hypothetical protein